MSNESVLIKYSLILQPDGRLRTQTDAIDHNELIVMQEEWSGASITAKAIKYLEKQLELLDKDLEKYILSL